MVRYHLMAVEHTTHTIGQDGKLRETHYADRMVNHAHDNGIQTAGFEKLNNIPLPLVERGNPQEEYWRQAYVKAKAIGITPIQLESPEVQALHSFSNILAHAIDNGVNSLADWKAFTSPLKKDIRSGQLELWHGNTQPRLIDALSEHMPRMNHADLVRLEAAIYYFRSLHMYQTAKAEKVDGIAVGLIHAIDIAKKNNMDLEQMPVFTDNPHLLDLNQHEHDHRFRLESYNEMKAIVERLVSAVKK